MDSAVEVRNSVASGQVPVAFRPTGCRRLAFYRTKQLEGEWNRIRREIGGDREIESMGEKGEIEKWNRWVKIKGEMDK